MGPLFACLIATQFQRIRQGDRSVGSNFKHYCNQPSGREGKLKPPFVLATVYFISKYFSVFSPAVNCIK